MPWNDNANPGPWGSPPQDDGRGNEDMRGRADPRRSPPPPPRRPGGPDWYRRLNDTLGGMFGGAGGRNLRPGVFVAIAAVLFFVWTLSGIYTVDASQEAVVTRFGVYDRSTGPGLHYHLPTPIERAEIVSVTAQRKTDIGGSAGAEDLAESLMLTGDENIVDLDFTVQWHVSNAAAYLFNVRDTDAAVQAVAESAMREVVGHSALQPILTSGRGRVQAETVALMQRTLNSYRSGVIIDAVQIRSASPPQEVMPDYQEIQKSQQDKERSVNEGRTYRNRVVNEAKGDAAKIVQDAQGYREQVVRNAEGQASRFNQIYAQYRQAPAVTRQRLYIEAMEMVLARSKKVVIDAKGSTAPIILPPDVFRPNKPAQAAPAPPPTQEPAQ
ncbi:MAG TPA: FtsH protease activity modulator HflK [Caulobacteraceae bacterium]|jgi:membrane protease subunit HflK|nr:FtsH protease activity modulator HflK [Caulobacteraceae bacterium]